MGISQQDAIGGNCMVMGSNYTPQRDSRVLQSLATKLMYHCRAKIARHHFVPENAGGGGAKWVGGGWQILTRTPPTENSLRPPSPRYILPRPPPHSFLLPSRLKIPEFPSGDLSQAIFGGSPKRLPAGHWEEKNTNKHKEIRLDTPTSGPQPSRGLVPFVPWKCPVCPRTFCPICEELHRKCPKYT